MATDLITMDLGALSKFSAELKMLPNVMKQKVLRGACKVAMEALRDECIKGAPLLQRGAFPSDTAPPGTLKKSIYSMRLPEDSSDQVEVWKVDVRKGAGKWKHKRNQGRDTNTHGAYWAKWVEFGHYSKTPVAKATDSRSIHKRRKVHQESGKAVWIPAQPFMRPAFDRMKADIPRLMQEYIDRNLNETMGTYWAMKDLGFVR